MLSVEYVSTATLAQSEFSVKEYLRPCQAYMKIPTQKYYENSQWLKVVN